MAYTTVKDVMETAGIFDRVDNLEAVGTGTGALTTFTLDNTPVITGTLYVYVAGVLKTETTHYTVDYNAGIITFTAGNIPTAGQAVTANYWYYPMGLDNSIITNFITDADAIVDLETGRSWSSQSANAELYDGEDFKDSDTMYVRADHTPIISVSAMSVDGTSITVATKIYVYNNEGKIRLKSNAEVTKFTDTTPQNVSVTYTYGSSSTPAYITDLSSHIAASHAIRSIMGGMFNEPDTWNLGSMSASVGDNASKLNATLSRIEEDIKERLHHLKKRPVIL